MKSNALLITLFAFVYVPVNLALGQADLQIIRSEYEKARDRNIKEYAGKASELAGQYLKSLKDLQKELDDKGDLKNSMIVAAEIERFDREQKIYGEVSDATLVILRNVEDANNREISRLKSEQAAQSKGTQSAAVPSEGNPVITTTVSGKEAGGKIYNCATEAEVTVSSTHYGENGESGPSALVDGNLFTRWSSDYSEPQDVTLHLKKPMILSRLRMHWEQASATKYCVYLSKDGKKWTSVYLYMKTGSSTEPASRVDDVDLKVTTAGWIKLDLQSCVNKEWGFSLYEIEIMGSDVAGDPGGGQAVAK